MVSSLFVDTLKNPTNSLLDLYDTCNRDDDFPAVVSKYFSDVFEKSGAFDEIPRLCVGNPPELYSDRSLVRFRAMVQDTSCGQELYLAEKRNGRCGGWGLADGTDVDEGTGTPDFTHLMECTVIWAVSVPGEATWCSQEGDKPDEVRTHTHQPSRPHKFPIPGNQHIGVQVKIYDNSATGPLKPTDIYTFVGILTTDALLSESEHIQIPTLHVLYAKQHLPTFIPPLYRDPISSDVSGIRNALIDWIAEEALAGDIHAAEWVLLTVLGRVHSRTPAMFPPSLTISRFPSPADRLATPALFHVLSQILPLSFLLPLSLDRLNHDNFTPESKDEDLYSGVLQVPAGSSFLITENLVEEGRLDEKGVTNIRSLQEIIFSQTISYNFPFSCFSFSTDINFVVLSEGRKSALLKTSIIVPLERAHGSHDLYKNNERIRLPSPEQLVAFRQFICGAKAGGTIGIDDATSEQIQADFVRERQEDTSVGAEALMLRMTFARLLARSMHHEVVDSRIWERTKTLDTHRKVRAQNF